MIPKKIQIGTGPQLANFISLFGDRNDIARKMVRLKHLLSATGTKLSQAKQNKELSSCN